MYKPISVSLSGPAFSFLLYENTKASYMQEGFLIGEVIHRETKTITDNDQQQINKFNIIKINSVIPCPQNSYFYNNVGKIDREKLQEFLGSQFLRVVAWYKYKKVSSFKFTLKEKTIHKQLSDLFNVSSELFTCCLLISESSDNLSTHMYQQAFVRYNNYTYDRVPIHITNLSEPNNTYKSAEASSESFKKILSDLKVDINKSQGLVVINKIHNALQKHTDSIVQDLSEAERRLFDLENEIKTLTEAQKARKDLHSSSFESSQSIDEEKAKEQNSEQDLIKFDSNPSSRERSPEVIRKATIAKGRGKRKPSLSDKNSPGDIVISSRTRKKN